MESARKEGLPVIAPSPEVSLECCCCERGRAVGDRGVGKKHLYPPSKQPVGVRDQPSNPVIFDTYRKG